MKPDSRLRGNEKTALSPSNLYPSRQRGVSLVELIMFIVIISVAVTGILLVMNKVTGHSADSLIRKQALAIAESLLEEVELMPFTYCDPDDTNAASATAATAAQCPAAGGVGGVEAMGPEVLGGAETRYAAPHFDNVNDYHGFSMSGALGIKDITNTPVSSLLNGYSASVSAAPQALGGVAGTDVNGAPQVLLITVTVTGPDNIPVTIEGYRTRYAPNDLP
ncbi:MAG TPA: prepilin-type N-terminal cleavage/methylation domain-containing protein [Gallionella sp.]|nr:prepilin-type N-terminal cleavage/methylation domain-containing protein [Gallionella sp.]